MNQWPKVSIVIATFNRARYLERTLNRLVENGYPNLEIVVVDGASTDGTVDLLRSYGDKIARWVSEPDDGEYFAYNKALGMATGEIIKLMTDDDVLRPEAFCLVADYFTAHPEADIVFGQTAIWQERKGIPKLVREMEERKATHLTLHHWLRGTHQVSSLGGFIRRRVFEWIGPLSIEYSCGDAEFWARAASQGIKMGLMPQVVVDYHYTGQNGMISKKWQIAADTVRIAAKYGNAVDVLVCAWHNYIAVNTYGPLLNGLAQVFHGFGLHPVRAWRKWRAGGTTPW